MNEPGHNRTKCGRGHKKTQQPIKNSVILSGWHWVGDTEWVTLSGWHWVGDTEWVTLSGWHWVGDTEWVTLSGWHWVGDTEWVTLSGWHWVVEHNHSWGCSQPNCSRYTFDQEITGFIKSWRHSCKCPTFLGWHSWCRTPTVLLPRSLVVLSFSALSANSSRGRNRCFKQRSIARYLQTSLQEVLRLSTVRNGKGAV